MNDKLETYPLPEGWHDFVCTKENIMMVWEKFNQFPILFDDMWRGDFKIFVEGFFDPRSIILFTGDYGIVKFSNILPGRDCDIHLTFWDKRFKGRDTECKQGLYWIFDKLKLHRATIYLPSTVRYTINFTKALGFKQEGTLRESWAYKEKFLDLCMFGILRNELFKEE